MEKSVKNSYKDDFIESLKNPKESLAYLRAALEEIDMPEVFLLALKRVVEAREGDFFTLNKKTNLSYKQIDSVFSKQFSSELKNIFYILDILGFKFSIDFKKHS